jgi:hypothetical protein
MPFLTSSPEKFRTELELITPMDLSAFNRLYMSIARAVAKDPHSRYYKLGESRDTFSYQKNDEFNLEIGSSRVAYTEDGSLFILSVEAECSPLNIEYGLVASVQPEYRDMPRFVLTENMSRHYITDEYSGDPISLDMYKELVSGISAL